jgi:ethanolamine-phosphate phospho-lyase
MDVVDDEQLQQHALNVGQYIFDNLEHKMKDEFEIIGDVRGTGLFVGIELVYNRYAPEPATKAAKWVVDRMKNVHKILVSSDGPDDNVVKLKPPMVFNQSNADQFLTAFRECLSTWQQQDQEVDKTGHTTQITSSTNCTIPTKIPERKHCLIKSV